MKIACINGHWHDVSPTGLALVIKAFQEGDLQTVGTDGVNNECLLKAFTEDRVKDFNRRYRGHVIRSASSAPIASLPITEGGVSLAQIE